MAKAARRSGSSTCGRCRRRAAGRPPPGCARSPARGAGDRSARPRRPAPPASRLPSPDSERVAAELTALAERAHAAAAGGPASPPVSAWHWPAFAAVVVPALALLVAVLVLRRQLAGGGRRVGRP